MGRPPLRLGRPKGRPQAPFQPSHENRYPFTNWSTFAPPKWSKFTPPLTQVQEPIEREEQQVSTETNERDEERTDQVGNEHGHERDQSARRIGDRAASTTDTGERAGNFDHTCAPARQPAQQRLTRRENFPCAELAMTPVRCHSQPTHCAYNGIWRRAPPPRPPQGDSARRAGSDPAGDAAVARPRRQELERGAVHRTRRLPGCHWPVVVTSALEAVCHAGGQDKV